MTWHCSPLRRAGRQRPFLSRAASVFPKPRTVAWGRVYGPRMTSLGDRIMSQPDLFVGIDVAKDDSSFTFIPPKCCDMWSTARPVLPCSAASSPGLLVRPACGSASRRRAVTSDSWPSLSPACRGDRSARCGGNRTLPCHVARRTHAHVHDPEAIKLAEHVRLRDLAVAQAVQLGNQLARTSSRSDHSRRWCAVSTAMKAQA